MFHPGKCVVCHVTEVSGDVVTVDLPEGAVGRATTHTAHGEYCRWFENTCPILNNGSAGKPLSFCHCPVCSHDHTITQQETSHCAQTIFGQFFFTLGIRATLFMGFSPSSFCKMDRERTHYILSDIIFIERVGEGGGDVLTELTELMCFTLTSSFWTLGQLHTLSTLVRMFASFHTCT